MINCPDAPVSAPPIEPAFAHPREAETLDDLRTLLALKDRMVAHLMDERSRKIAVLTQEIAAIKKRMEAHHRLYPEGDQVHGLPPTHEHN